MKLFKHANKDVHFEFSTDNKEVEIYVGGWFLSSVNILDISEEAKEYLFETETLKEK